MTLKTTSRDSEHTLVLGGQIAAKLKGGETVELIGDLGSGKTTLAKGLIRGLGWDGEVSSPSFTLSRDYPIAAGKTVRHFDLYRLSGHDVVSDQLVELLDNPDVINVVEWAAHGEADLPKERIVIKLSYAADENEREIEITSTQQELMKELQSVLGA